MKMHQDPNDCQEPRHDHPEPVAHDEERALELAELMANLAAVRTARRGKDGDYGKAQQKAIARLEREIDLLTRGEEKPRAAEQPHAVTPEARAVLFELLDDPSSSATKRRKAQAILRREEMRFSETEGQKLGLLPAAA